MSCVLYSVVCIVSFLFLFFKQKTAYEMRISDWSSDVCSSDLVGRLPVVATLEDLDEGALIEILTQPKNALLEQYARLFEMEDVRLEFTEDALKAIALKAFDRKTRARGPRPLLVSILLHPLFAPPGLDHAAQNGVYNGSKPC